MPLHLVLKCIYALWQNSAWQITDSSQCSSQNISFLETVLELLGPIKEELKQICKAVKKSFKAEPELAFAAEGSEAIGSGVRSATQGMTDMPIIKGHVLEDSTIHTDGWKAYDGLILNGYDHYRVYHSKNEFTRGKNHVNGIESF